MSLILSRIEKLILGSLNRNLAEQSPRRLHPREKVTMMVIAVTIVVKLKVMVKMK